MKKLLLLNMFLISSASFALEGALRLPMNFENAKVLPKGIRNVRFMDSRIDAVNSLNGSGNVVPIGNALNKSVTWGESIKGKKDFYEQAVLRGTLKNYGIKEDEYIGDTTGMVNIAVNAQIPVIAYGVNKKWTMAVAIPYITDDISVDAGWVANENLNKFVRNTVQGTRNSEHKAYKVQFDTLNAIEQKLEDNGYKTLGSSNGRRTRIGDIRLVSKYQYAKEDNYMSALRVEVVAPTGETLDVDKAVDLATGDGQWDLGLGMASQYDFDGAFSLSGFAGVTVQLPTARERRIPEESDSRISADKDPNTTIDFGDILKVETALTYKFWNGFSFINGIGYQYKTADRFSGNRFASERYDWLETDTQQNMTTYQAGLGFSTIPLFQQKKFKVPLQANLFYTSVVEGKNVLKDDILTFEMALFF
jgi:hypothetical protein